MLMTLQQVVNFSSEMVTKVHMDIESISIVYLSALIDWTLLSEHKPRLLISNGLKIGFSIKINVLAHASYSVTSRYSSVISNQEKQYLCKEVSSGQANNVKFVVISKFMKQDILYQRVCVSSGVVRNVYKHFQLWAKEMILTNTAHRRLCSQNTIPRSQRTKSIHSRYWRARCRLHCLGKKSSIKCMLLDTI